MQQQQPSPPQSPSPRPSMTPFKKRLLHRVKSPTDEKEDADYSIEKQERQENEYKDPSYEAEEDEWGPQGVEQGQGDKFNETYMIKRDERKMEEEDISEDNMYDENGFDPDGYKKERHTVVQERQKKKELEVFVGGLDRDTTEVDLREVFSEVGDVTEVRLLMNPMTNKNKGFAFIRFATVEQVRRALSL